MQARQNTSALRQATSTSKTAQNHRKQDQCVGAAINQADNGSEAPNSMELMRDLSAQMDSLRQEYARHAENIRNLEIQVGNSEAECGDLLQQYLRLGRAIELKEKHIKEDRTNLAQLQRVKESTRQRLESTLTRISSLARPD